MIVLVGWVKAKKRNEWRLNPSRRRALKDNCEFIGYISQVVPKNNEKAKEKERIDQYLERNKDWTLVPKTNQLHH